MRARRIVSLLPGCTEIVHALGLGDQLVGRSHECDFPPEVGRLPACTTSRLDAAASSREIDREIKTLIRDALSIYRVEADLLRSLRPDVILTQTQCEVCAVSLAEVETAVSEWTSARPRIVSVAPDSLDDVWNDITTIADVLDARTCGVALIARLKERIERINRQTRLLPHPSVACIEWLDPLMAAGNWVPELVEFAGGLNLFGESGKHSPWLNWEAIVDHDPDLLIVMPCGFDLDRTRREMPALMKRPGWSELRSVRAGRVHVTDGGQYFNRPGPRLVESLEILAECCHPGVFCFGHEGHGWQRL